MEKKENKRTKIGSISAAVLDLSPHRGLTFPNRVGNRAWSSNGRAKTGGENSPVLALLYLEI